MPTSTILNNSRQILFMTSIFISSALGCSILFTFASELFCGTGCKNNQIYNKLNNLVGIVGGVTCLIFCNKYTMK